jgi:hypothetical protein
MATATAVSSHALVGTCRCINTVLCPECLLSMATLNIPIPVFHLHCFAFFDLGTTHPPSHQLPRTPFVIQHHPSPSSPWLPRIQLAQAGQRATKSTEHLHRASLPPLLLTPMPLSRRRLVLRSKPLLGRHRRLPLALRPRLPPKSARNHQTRRGCHQGRTLWRTRRPLA